MIDNSERLREVLAGTDFGEREITTIKLNSGALIFSVALDHAEEVLPMWSAARSVLEQTGRWPVLTPHYGDPPAQDVHRRRLVSDSAIDDARLALSEIREERERVWPSRPMIDGLEQELEKTRFYFDVAPSRDEVLAIVPADAPPAELERWLFEWERRHEPTGRTRGGDHMQWFFQPGEALRFFPVLRGPDTLAYAPPQCRVPGNSLERMIAILERWETRYGAELVANHGTMLQWIVANPPRTLEECWELTVEHELVAPDTFILPAVSMRERCSAVRRGGFTIDRSGREHRRNAGPPGRVKTARAPRQNYVRAAGVMASLLKPSPRRWRPNVAIAMARSGGHQLTDAILRSVALVAGTRVEVVRQTSTNAPV